MSRQVSRTRRLMLVLFKIDTCRERATASFRWLDAPAIRGLNVADTST